MQYAGDTTLYFSESDLKLKMVCNTVNVQLEKFYHKVRLNKLSLNTDITQYIGWIVNHSGDN